MQGFSICENNNERAMTKMLPNNEKKSESYQTQRKEQCQFQQECQVV